MTSTTTTATEEYVPHAVTRQVAIASISETMGRDSDLTSRTSYGGISAISTGVRVPVQAKAAVYVQLAKIVMKRMGGTPVEFHSPTRFEPRNEVRLFLGTLVFEPWGANAWQGVRFVHRQLNAWLNGEQFQLCDEALSKAPVERMGVDIILSFLTVTFAAKARLPSRELFYSSAFKVVTKARGPEIANKLLGYLS